MKAGLAWFWLVTVATCLLYALNADSRKRDQSGTGGQPLQISSGAEPAFSPELRVNVTGSPVTEFRLTVDGPFRIVPAGSSRTLSSSQRLAESVVSATENGIRIGQTEYPTTRLEIVADSPPAIWVGDHQYRGRVQVFRQQRGRLIAVNVVSLEEYVASVLDGEMPADFPTAAREAQAIVARTYALYQTQESHDHSFFDLYASTRSQKYLGVQYRDARGRRLAGESDSSRRACAATSGIVCTYQGRVFSTYYTAACGGKTITGREVFADAASPLVSVPCDWCRESKFFRWSAQASHAQLDDAISHIFASRKQPFGEVQSIAVSSNSPADGVPVLSVSDGKRKLTISSADLRRELSATTLPSPQFEIRDDGDVVHFEGRGHGHCVGFCQWGARGQALAGRSALDIIRHYYHGVEIVRLRESSL